MVEEKQERAYFTPPPPPGKIGLRPGHRSRDCSDDKLCVHCGKRNAHHRSLCPEKFSIDKQEQKGEEKPKKEVMASATEEQPETIEADSLLASEEKVLIQTAKTTVKNTTKDISAEVRTFLDCGSQRTYISQQLTRDRSNNITTKLYDKRDAFGFHIVNFPFMSSNIPSAPAYGVYASQLVRYARCCSNYSDFLIRHRALVKRLLSQGYKVNRLSNTFKKFYGRHTDLVGQYKKNVCQMFADSIS